MKTYHAMLYGGGTQEVKKDDMAWNKFGKRFYVKSNHSLRVCTFFYTVENSKKNYIVMKDELISK